MPYSRYTITRLHESLEGKPFQVVFETDDDNDDGVVDPEIVFDTYYFKTLDQALRFTGEERVGIYGHKVAVRYEGKPVTKAMVRAAEDRLAQKD